MSETEPRFWDGLGPRLIVIAASRAGSSKRTRRFGRVELLERELASRKTPGPIRYVETAMLQRNSGEFRVSHLTPPGFGGFS
jgi:hypothetical protein